MRRTLVVLGIVAVLFGMPLPAHAWGSATHAFIADHLGTKLEPLNAQELYGAMAPDLFQTDIALNSDPLLFGYTHGAPGYEPFMAVWSDAHNPLDRAFARGWLTHNEVWGADSTAHGNGYVIQKAMMLEAGLGQAGVWAMVEQQTGLQLAYEDRLLFCHLGVEYAGDVVLRQLDPKLGEKIVAAGMLRAGDVPKLLVHAMAGADPAAVTLMEDRFRRYMVLYGGTMLQDDADAVRGFAHDMGRFAAIYLQYRFPELPVDDLRPLLEQLSGLAITESFPLLADYPGAVFTTIDHVKAELDAHGIPLH